MVNNRYSDEGEAGFGFSGDVVLLASRVKAVLNGVVAEVEICHEFVNREPDDIEAVYSFSLPLDATLLSLGMQLDGKQYLAEVVSKSTGARRYEDAVTDGDSAVLLIEEAPGLYSMSVGNLQPGDSITVTLNYAEALRWDNRKLRFYFPTTLGERYGDSRRAGFAEHQQIEHSLDNGARLDFSLTVFGELASTNVRSPSHPLKSSREDGSLTLSGNRLVPDRDIIITLDAPHSYLGEVLVEQSSYGEQYAALLLAPETGSASLGSTADVSSATNLGRCFQFVVDCSGSMAGDSMRQTQKALQSIAMLLEPGDWFNMVCFGSHAQSLFEMPKPLNTDSMRELLAWISTLDASMGGTEMEAALNLARETGAHLRLDTDIFLITDGEVWNSDGIIGASNAARMRVFTVGVGSSVNQPLLERIARQTGGAAVFVSPNESMADAVVGHFRRCRSQPLTSLSINWPRAITQQQGNERYFCGDSIALYGAKAKTTKAGRAPLAPELLTLSYQLAGKGHECELPTRPYRGLQDGTLARIAAKARLEFEAWPEKLALEYRLLSPFTSCVLVAEREHKASGMPQLKTIKHTRPAGEHGFGSVMASAPVCSPVLHHDMPFDDIVYSSAPPMPMQRVTLAQIETSMPEFADWGVLAFLRQDCTYDLTDSEELLDMLNQAVLNNSLTLSLAGLKSIGIVFGAKLHELLSGTDSEADEALLVLGILKLLLEQTSDQRRARTLRRWVRAQPLSVPPELLDAIKARIAGPVAA